MIAKMSCIGKYTQARIDFYDCLRIAKFFYPALKGFGGLKCVFHAFDFNLFCLHVRGGMMLFWRGV